MFSQVEYDKSFGLMDQRKRGLGGWNLKVNVG